MVRTGAEEKRGGGGGHGDWRYLDQGGQLEAEHPRNTSRVFPPRGSNAKNSCRSHLSSWGALLRVGHPSLTHSQFLHFYMSCASVASAYPGILTVLKEVATKK